VLIDLLERKIRRTKSLDLRHALESIRDSALRKREREMVRARRKLASRKLFTLPQATQKLSTHLAQLTNRKRAMLVSSLREGYARWCEALVPAGESLDPADIHVFRIQTKRLRYRIELARDLGETGATGALAYLKARQDELGRWHDHAVLANLTAEVLADPQFLLEKSRIAAALLRKLDRDRAVQMKRIRQLLTTERQRSEASPLDAWVNQYLAQAPVGANHAPIRAEPLASRESTLGLPEAGR
jgi:hypothetical protein